MRQSGDTQRTERPARRWLPPVRAVLGVLTLAAMAVQFSRASDRPAFEPANFISFFTIQSNLIGAAVLLWGAAPRQRTSRARDIIRGAATVNLAVTGVVYDLLLSNDPAAVAVTLPWVNVVLHQLLPIAVVVDWIVDPPASVLRLRDAVWWLGYPAVWVVATLVRGGIVGWYPYPFLDPAKHGAAGVAGYVAAIAVGFVAVIAALAISGNRRRRPSATRVEVR